MTIDGEPKQLLKIFSKAKRRRMNGYTSGIPASGFNFAGMETRTWRQAYPL
jgi:hypothetical protein